MSCLSCNVKGKRCGFCRKQICELPKCIREHFFVKRRRPFEKRSRRYCRRRKAMEINHPKNCLICSINPPNARLEEWRYAEGDRTVCGKVFGDKEQRWKDGSFIFTSQIKTIDVQTGHLRTLNSNYILGERSKE